MLCIVKERKKARDKKKTPKIKKASPLRSERGLTVKLNGRTDKVICNVGVAKRLKARKLILAFLLNSKQKEVFTATFLIIIG